MSDSAERVEFTLTVDCDPDTASHVAEILARFAVGLSAEKVVVSTLVDRYQTVCHHEHEVEP